MPGSFLNTAGLAPTTISAAGVPLLTATWDSFPLNSTSTLTFQATINAAVIPGQVITNTASQTWTSLPGIVGPQSTYNTFSCERTGDTLGCGGTQNDYSSSDPATVTIFAPAPVKSIVQTSETHTASPGGVVRLAVGEIVRYRLAVLIPEASLNDLYLLDRLQNPAAGLRFLDDGTARAAFVCNSGANCITSSNPLMGGLPVLNGNSSNVTPTFTLPDDAVSAALASDTDTYVDGTDVFFKFSQVVNNDRDLDAEYLVVEFNAIVTNVSGNQIQYISFQ